MEEYLAYLHIPFCDSKCHYCSFNSFVYGHQNKKAYMYAIIRQLEHDLEKFEIKKQQISSLFIGGGTPSTCKSSLYKDFFTCIKPYLAKNCEITSEANPNSATLEWLEGMRELGVNRISFGVQSFDDEKLKYLGRTHDKKGAIKAINDAKKAGFENISLDLIYASKFDTEEFLQNELNEALSLPINHISAYSLSIEEGTLFFKQNVQNKENEKAAEFLVQNLHVKGFERYEVSNYGLACKHNLGYWQHKSYLGIGAGAVGFENKKDAWARYYPHTNLESYIKEPLYKKEEILTQKDLHVEKIFLGLRSMVGVKKSLLNKEQIQRATLLCEENKLTCKNETYYCNEYFLADEMTLFLID